MSPTPLDQRTIDPEIRAELEAAYAGIERQQLASLHGDTSVKSTRSLTKPLRDNAVAELTAHAKEQSNSPDTIHEAKLQQVWVYTKYINDLRDNKLRNQ